MPAYGVSPSELASQATPDVVFNNEVVAAGTASRQVNLPSNPGYGPKCFSVEIGFAGNPGAFQVDIQTADTDDNAHYVTIFSVSSGLNASFNTRAEMVNVVAEYVRTKVVTLTNAVATTQKIFS